MVESGKVPAVAYLCILDKKNQPVLCRNYLCEYLLKQQESSYDIQNSIESLRMQMSMIIYAAIDVLEEKQKVHIRKQSSKSNQQTQQDWFKPFLGLMQECFVSQYELDLYGQITPNNYKLLLMKNETLTNYVGQKQGAQ